MSVLRHFLGWGAPLAQKVCDYLLKNQAGRPVDLSDLLVIVSTQQAGRRLREALARRCAERDTGLLAPRLVVPAFFLKPDGAAADEAGPIQVAAAWCDVLQRVDLKKYSALMPTVPLARDFGWALRISSLLQGLRETLADGGATIADVIQQQGAHIHELDRWHDLRKLEKEYLQVLAERKLRDPCIVELKRAEKPEVPAGVKRIVVAAVPDPAPLALRAWEKIAAHVPMDVLIHAPDDMAETFSPWGLPLVEKWRDAEIEIPDPVENILLAASPAGQARQVLDLISGSKSKQLAVGVPDTDVVPHVASALNAKGLSAFDPAGQPVSGHPIFHLLSIYCDLRNGERFQDLARFLRHADVVQFLEKARGVNGRRMLEQLDACQNDQLPLLVEDVKPSDKDVDLHRGIAFVREALALSSIRDFLRLAYSFHTIDPQREAGAAFVSVANEINLVIEELAALPDLNISDGLELLRQSLRGRRYYPDRDPSDIDLEGWLELPWNEAPFLIVTGMNDGVVPVSHSRDAFLPDSLRSRLGIRDDARLLARDAFLMRSLIESRRKGGRVCFVVGKTSSVGDPLKPSRLLFRCAGAELAARARQLFRRREEQRDNLPWSASFKLDASPPPGVSLDLKRMHVTGFRDYLACPFRFYLGHVLEMETVDAEKAELDAMEFGNLVHTALQAMASDPDLCRETDAEKISRFLGGVAEAWVAARFGMHAPLPVLVQLESARQRLAAAARVHAQTVKDGWEIVSTERRFKSTMGGMEIQGCVDRIDIHRGRKIVRVLDYKTFDTAKDPQKTHLGKARGDESPYAIYGDQRWLDLQLPLYGMLLKNEAEFRGRQMEVGYFHLPKAVSGTAIALWPGYNEAVEKSARECAEGVIRDLKARRFWPPAEYVDFDNFEALFPGGISVGIDEDAFLKAMEARTS